MPAIKKNLFVDRGAEVLRETALPVEPKDISSKKIEAVISKMKKALHGEEDGVAIAAPQIGVGLRIFVVKGSAIAMASKKKADQEREIEDEVYVNPEIIKASKKKQKMEEGCLSLRYLYGHVLRHEKVTVRAYDESGKLRTVGASGLLSQIFQHEIDHLNGILFIDKAENVKDAPPEEDGE